MPKKALLNPIPHGEDGDAAELELAMTPRSSRIQVRQQHRSPGKLALIISDKVGFLPTASSECQPPSPTPTSPVSVCIAAPGSLTGTPHHNSNLAVNSSFQVAKYVLDVLHLPELAQPTSVSQLSGSVFRN